MRKQRVRPKPGQESVWDYPRPPRLESTSASILIKHAGQTIAQSNRCHRVLETSHPPVYYIRQEDILMSTLQPSDRPSSFCEFKGSAIYWDLCINGSIIHNVAWSYPNPSKAFTPIQNHLAFYASKFDACYVNDELVQSQQGDFYGGWVTSNIVGPFKGGPGTWGW